MAFVPKDSCVIKNRRLRRAKRTKGEGLMADHCRGDTGDKIHTLEILAHSYTWLTCFFAESLAENVFAEFVRGDARKCMAPCMSLCIESCGAICHAKVDVPRFLHLLMPNVQRQSTSAGSSNKLLMILKHFFSIDSTSRLSSQGSLGLHWASPLAPSRTETRTCLQQNDLMPTAFGPNPK
jgi:hypothetical protein